MSDLTTGQPQTLAATIRHAASEFAGKTAIISPERAMPYGDLANRIDRVASWAACSAALNAGDRVLLIASNCAEYFELVAGLADARLAVVTLNPQLSQAEIVAIIADSEPAVAFVDPALESACEAARSAGLPLYPARGPEYEKLIAAVEPDLPGQRPAPQDCFAICYTSGTTGKPKGVMLSHRSRVETIKAMAQEYGCYDASDSFLALTPFCHGAGFAFAAAPLFFGGRVVLGNDLRGLEILERVGQGDIAGLFIVPTHAKRFLEDPVAAREALAGHTLKALISNAAGMPQTLKTGLVGLFGEGLYHEAYGSTEAGIVTNIRPADQLRTHASVGLPFPGNEVELRDAGGVVLHGSATGELFSRSPYLFNGYLNRPEETETAMQDGWVSVGDIARRDEEGFYYIVDRKSDMIVSGGMNVYPKEIENAVAGDERIIESAAVGIPDNEWGEAVCLFYVTTEDADISGDLANVLADSLAPYKRPKRLVRIAELPRNAGGKVLRRELKALAR